MDRKYKYLIWITLPVVILLAGFIFYLPTVSAAALTKEDCLGCHADKSLTAETARGKTLNLYVPGDALKGSVHEDFACTDCHKVANEKLFEEIPHGPTPPRINCAECHDDVYAIYIKSDIHGHGFSEGNPRAPYCHNCHGGHNILPLLAPESAMSRLNQPATCGNCHSQEKLNLEANITKRNLITRYQESVHYQAIKEGKNGAICTDCHSHHNILSSSDPKSTVGRTVIMNVCDKCHSPQVKVFNDGPHGRSLQHGNSDVPNCITCHGDHDMASLRLRVGEAKQWAATQVCIWCHNNERMMARYGLNTIPVQSYMKDFHGLTQRGTMGASATCSDCHDAHHCLPSTHPASRMNISNRGAACGKCHGIVSDTFAMSFTHRAALGEPGPGLHIENVIRDIYIIVIILSVSLMFSYNFLIWLWAVRNKYKSQLHQGHIIRMSRYELISHFILFITFSILAITGFALKFPETFWAKWLFSVGMNETVRRLIHRSAAVIMTTDFILFAFYMIMRKRGRGMLFELFPKKRDFTDFIKSVKFYLSTSNRKDEPKSAIFNFGEKFEFWALVWGTVIMLLSGLILWFPKALPTSWPAWIISLSRVVHYYEALLATLAIIIWHGFHTIFHPNEYPLSTSWLTGYISETEAKHRFEDKAVRIMQLSGKREEKKSQM
ncbi:MAG TPA: cytochrome b/b6 domain-containing protein [Candidatus Deferrimicrobium sp.]|nr:cytochrome b/b6 domain-containing protein [Candidatus Deferrimicrobium sp.]